MKSVVTVLILISLAAGIATVTGFKYIALSGNGAALTHHSLGGRVGTALVAVTFGVAVYGCSKKQMYAWWLTAWILVLLAVYEVAWTMRVVATSGMDFLGNGLGALGKASK